MRSVMIVDDERPARELLKMIIDWKSVGFYILWEAKNGKQALEQYEKTAPDLIITDIQMPSMDGLELLQKIREISPNQKVVILSCHENFTYARKALQYGVMDYFIKDSLTEEMIYNLLLRISEEEDTLSSSDLQPPSSPGILEKLCSSDKVEKNIAFDTLKENLNKSKDFFLCVCKLESFTGIQAEWEMITQEILNLLHDSYGGDAFVTDQNQLAILCMIEHESSKMQTYNNRFLILQHIRKHLELLTGCTVSIGVSNHGYSIDQLENLLKEALLALESKVFQGIGKTLYYNKEQDRSQKFEIDLLNNLFREIRKSVEQMDEETLQKILSTIYNKNLSGVVHYNYLNYVNAILLDILMDSCNSKHISYSIVFGSEELPMDVFDELNTVDKMREWFTERFFYIFKATNTLKINYSPRVKKILDYIQNNFQQDISLENIADTFWLHKVYLAKIFKQETGKSVNEYIRSVRIERAKEMLCRDNIKINEIVIATGFNNPQNFYTIFKKVTGMKPGEYREKYIKEKDFFGN